MRVLELALSRPLYVTEFIRTLSTRCKFLDDDTVSQKTCCWHRCGTMLRERKMILSKQHFSSLLLMHMWNFNLKNYHSDYFSSSYVTYLFVYFTTKSLQLNGSHCWSFHLEVYYLSVYTTTVHTMTVHTELETGTSRPLKTPKKKNSK